MGMLTLKESKDINPPNAIPDPRLAPMRGGRCAKGSH